MTSEENSVIEKKVDEAKETKVQAPEASDAKPAEPVKRRRGRPRKVAVKTDATDTENTAVKAPTPTRTEGDEKEVAEKESGDKTPAAKPRRTRTPRKPRKTETSGEKNTEEAKKPTTDTSENDGKNDNRSPRSNNPRNNNRNNKNRNNTSNARGSDKRRRNSPKIEEDEALSDELSGVTLHIRDVVAMSPQELLEKADALGIDNLAGMRKQEQVSAILRAHGLHGGTIYSEGVLEILPDGFGWSR